MQRRKGDGHMMREDLDGEGQRGAGIPEQIELTEEFSVGEGREPTS